MYDHEDRLSLWRELVDTVNEVDRILLLVLSRRKQIARALASLVYEI